MQQQVLFWATLCLSSALVGGQFLQPQSHLSRLMQSISPLVLNQASSYREASEPEPAGPEPIAAAGYYGQPETHSSAEGEAGADFDAWPAARPAKRPAMGYSREANHHHQQQQQYSRQQAALQQAPSQQRGVPQRYQRPTMGADGESAGSSYDEEPAARGSGAGRGSSRAAAQQQADSEQYRMGAYLGPTVDDREINQAFGGSGQDADDDAAPGGGYGHGQAGSQGRAQASRQQAASYGPSANSYDDDSGADEDEAEPASGRNRHNHHHHHRAGLSSAASQQSRQNRGYGPREQQQQQQLMAAANGYAPNGYAAGPMDLSGLMAAGVEVYNGDGSYPGYYPPQQMPARQRGGNRNQAGSMMNPYNGGPYGGGGSQQSNADNDNDDQDSDADED